MSWLEDATSSLVRRLRRVVAHGLRGVYTESLGGHPGTSASSGGEEQRPDDDGEEWTWWTCSVGTKPFGTDGALLNSL